MIKDCVLETNEFGFHVYIGAIKEEDGTAIFIHKKDKGREPQKVNSEIWSAARHYQNWFSEPDPYWTIEWKNNAHS